jgi:hypothetical protein
LITRCVPPMSTPSCGPSASTERGSGGPGQDAGPIFRPPAERVAYQTPLAAYGRSAFYQSCAMISRSITYSMALVLAGAREHPSRRRPAVRGCDVQHWWSPHSCGSRRVSDGRRLAGHWRTTSR